MLNVIPLAQLRESPHNPRKHFDAAQLAELTASVARSGVLEPVIVRAVPAAKGKTPTYELASGHRRFRAAQAAGLTEIPAYVRDLDDGAFYELLTVANLQRADPHALEEADAYAAMMTTLGWDVATIAQRIGKSERYVYDRLKFRTLIPAARDIFFAGRITAAHAVELSRLGAEAQARAMEPDGRALWERESGTFGPDEEIVWEEGDARDADPYQGYKPRTVGELRAWVTRAVRFVPAEADPLLFPETVAAVQAAAEEALKVVYITRDQRVSDAAKADGQRTYGAEGWRRADGQKDPHHHYGAPQIAKTCDHGVLGVVVAGEGRGEAFTVCIANTKCRVHWGDKIRAKEKAAQAPAAEATPAKARGEEPWQKQERLRKEALDRLTPALPAIAKAFAAVVATAPAHGQSKMAALLLQEWEFGSGTPHAELVKKGKSAEDFVRWCAWQIIAGELSSGYHVVAALETYSKMFGVDTKALVKAAQPKVEKGKVEKPKPAKAARTAKAS